MHALLAPEPRDRSEPRHLARHKPGQQGINHVRRWGTPGQEQINRHHLVHGALARQEPWYDLAWHLGIEVGVLQIGASEHGGRGAILPASFAPTGRALPADGGYRVSGQRAFGSGCLDTEWLLCGAVVVEDGQPRLGPDGQLDAELFLLPAAQCEIVDTWYAMGMRGTGGHDFAVADAFVPATHSFPRRHFATGAASRAGRGDQRPFLEVAPLCLPSAPLGIARHAIEAFISLAATKTATGATSPLAQQPVIHEKLGRAEALLGAGRAYLYETARWVSITPEDEPSLITQARLAGVQAAQSARVAVDLAHEAGEGTSIDQTSPLERCFRDVNTATHHFMISPGAFGDAGKALLTPQVCLVHSQTRWS
jgi:alkylation response protein AidB-like acyl-CoA dehydrogenase